MNSFKEVLFYSTRLGSMISMLKTMWSNHETCFRTLGDVPLTLVGSSPKLGGDSRRYNARQIESVGWVESRSEGFSRSRK